MPFVARLLRRSLILLLSLVAALILLAVFSLLPSRAVAEPGARLSVTATRLLSVTGQAVGLIVEGPADLLSVAVPATLLASDDGIEGGEDQGAAGLPATDADGAVPQITVRLYGPLTLEQVGQPVERLPAPRLLSPSMRSAPGGRTLAGPDDAAAMAVVPPDAFTEPGAYFASVIYSVGEVELAEGGAWFGRMLVEHAPLQVACVWPLVQGVHRDPDGVFFDDRLEQALRIESESESSLQGGPGRLWDLVDLAERFPDWRFTLAIEPILLTQLGEMARGYSRVDPPEPAGGTGPAGGPVQQVGPEDDSALAARGFLDGLKKVTVSGRIDAAATPYATPSAAVLGAQDWGDGVGQMRLGRQVVQQVLPLTAPVMGAYTPDLDLNTESLSAFSGGSIDHLLVDASVARDLAEPPPEGTATVRARDTESERLTLVLADSRLRSLMSEPWDPGLFCAGVAARVLDPAQALVLTPESASSVPPLAFMTGLGEGLAEVSWLETVTVEELVRSHPPGTRPILLERPLAPASSYLSLSLLDSVTSARAAVNTLTASAGLTAAPVQQALLLVYTAESHWWSHPQTSPRTASVGLDYALRAEALAGQELQKMVVAGVDGTRIMGDRGDVVLRLENQAEYPVTGQVSLEGTGVAFPDGTVIPVQLQPGLTEVAVAVSKKAGPHSIEVELLAGDQVVDAWRGGVEFVTVAGFLPWILAGSMLVVLVSALLLLRQRRGGGGETPTGRRR